MKLKKGDKVKVMTGKDRGKEASVEKVFAGKVAMTGINVYKRHSKPRGQGQKGGIVEFARPMDVSKVALVCPKCKQITRVGFKLTKNEKIRVCKKCDQDI